MLLPHPRCNRHRRHQRRSFAMTTQPGILKNTCITTQISIDSEAIKKYKGFLDPPVITKSLQDLTVARVLNYLRYIFEIPPTTSICIFWKAAASKGTVTECTTLERLWQYCYAGDKANTVHISFRGGPPTDRRWYHGTLLTILVDYFYQAIIFGETEKVNTLIDCCAR